MTNTYSNIAFGLLIALFSIVPSFGDAASFEQTGRTYYPAGNTQPITIVNNNYNNNANTNTAPVIAQTPAPTVYTAPVSTYRGADVNNIAKNNLPRTYTRRATTKNTYVDHSTHIPGTHGPDCGAKVAIAGVKVPKPTCSLVPALSANGAIELQWTTAGATVAYLDNGIGHVNTVRGKRIVTPSKNTAYNLTVLNDAGIASSCGAKVNVSLAKAGEVNVIAYNNNYSYSLNGATQAASVSSATVTGGNTKNTGVNTATMGITDKNKVNTDVDIKEDTTAVEEVKSTSILSKIFGDGFKKVAVPIGIVFLILIVLLMFIMSKVNAAK